MFRKFFVAILLALVVALPFSSIANADTLPGATHSVGTVLWVNQANGTFKLQTNGYVRMTVHVNNGTIYRGISSFAALKADDYVNVQLKIDDAGQFVAAQIYVYEPTTLVSTVNGAVMSIDGSSFTLKGNDGVTYTFQVDYTTSFSGTGMPHFRQLAVGMIVHVTYRNMGGGTLLAQLVTLIRLPMAD